MILKGSCLHWFLGRRRCPYIVFRFRSSYGFMFVYIYIYIPHGASYNIAATTTCASRVSVLVGHRKKAPPVQVTVATTTCVSRVSALVGHRKRPPVQVTVAPAPFAPPHVPESICAQWLKKKTTSASYSRSEPAPPPLECTLQQANVSLPKGMPLNWGAWEEIQWHALRQVTFACCSVHSNGGGAGSDRL